MDSRTTRVGRPDAERPAVPAADPARRLARPGTQLACALGVIAPMAIIAIWVARVGESITLETMFLGPMVGGGTLIFWILLLQLIVCRDSLEALGFRPGRPWVDLAFGACLAAGMLAFRAGFAATLARFVPRPAPAPQIVELITGVVRDPWLLALWLGPVVWVGVALFEELARCFLLRRFWLVWPGPAGHWCAILLVAALTGICHAYQGPAAILSIGLTSVALGYVFLRCGRILPLVVGHALYDSAQIVAAAIALRGAGG